MRYMHGSGHSTVGIDLLFKERELLWIGWNMERVMFDCCVFPTFSVRMKVI